MGTPKVWKVLLTRYDAAPRQRRLRDCMRDPVFPAGPGNQSVPSLPAKWCELYHDEVPGSCRFRGLGFWGSRVQNQMEKNMDNEMEAGII